MRYKLSDYAKKFNVTYRTAWNRYKAGKIDNCKIDDTGHVYIDIPELGLSNKCAIYSRVSNADRKDNLDRQSERLTNYSINNGYNILYNIKEIGSGLNDNRPKLIKLLKQSDWDILVVENKDRLTRFGFNYLEIMLNINNKKIVVVNRSDESNPIIDVHKMKNKEDIIKFLEE